MPPAISSSGLAEFLRVQFAELLQFRRQFSGVSLQFRAFLHSSRSFPGTTTHCSNRAIHPVAQAFAFTGRFSMRPSKSVGHLTREGRQEGLTVRLNQANREVAR